VHRLVGDDQGAVAVNEVGLILVLALVGIVAAGAVIFAIIAGENDE
jgi:Flp pilus assembly pilin Flp